MKGGMKKKTEYLKGKQNRNPQSQHTNRRKQCPVQEGDVTLLFKRWM